MERALEPMVVWAQAPSLGRLLKEALAYAALIGGLVGSLTLVFQRSFVGVPLGIGIGTAYGLFLAFGGWTIGWLLVRLRMIGRKGMALGLGVAIFAAVCLVVLSSLGGTLEPFLIVTPSVVAAAVAIWRGVHYDRAVTK